MSNKIIEVGHGKVKKVKIGGDLPLAFIGGPCAIENRDHALFMAESIKKICSELEIPWIYKSCYDKDCRSSPKSFHGVGIDEGLRILSEVRDKFGVPVISDFSEPSDKTLYIFPDISFTNRSPFGKNAIPQGIIYPSENNCTL